MFLSPSPGPLKESDERGVRVIGLFYTALIRRDKRTVLSPLRIEGAKDAKADTLYLRSVPVSR